MAVWLEVSAGVVDRGVDPPQSSTVGMVRFNFDDPEAPPETMNPFDYKTVAVLKQYLDGLWAEFEAISLKMNAPA